MKKEPRGQICGKFNAFLCCLWTLTLSSVLLVPWLNLQARPFDPLASWVSWTTLPDASQTQLIKTDLICPLGPASPLEFSIWGSTLPPTQYCTTGPSPSWRLAQAKIRTHGYILGKILHSSPFSSPPLPLHPSLRLLPWPCLSPGL